MTASRYAAAKSTRVRHSSADIAAGGAAAARDFRLFRRTTSSMAIEASLQSGVAHSRTPWQTRRHLTFRRQPSSVYRRESVQLAHSGRPDAVTILGDLPMR